MWNLHAWVDISGQEDCRSVGLELLYLLELIDCNPQFTNIIKFTIKMIKYVQSFTKINILSKKIYIYLFLFENRKHY